MNSGRQKRQLVFAAALTACVVVTGCSGIGILTDELFNQNFLVDSGQKQGAETQITPSTPNLLLIRITNNTNFPVTINTEIVRQVAGTVEGPSFDMLSAGQTVGEVFEQCDTDTPQIIRIKPLISQVVGGEAIQVPDIYVWVDGFPIPPSLVPSPLVFGKDFSCGDTVEYIIQTIPQDPNRYRVVAAVYDAGL